MSKNTNESQWEKLVEYAKADIENFNGFQDDRAIVWAANEIKTLKEANKNQDKPMAYQFQDREGKWCHFIGQKHYEDTVADGTWPIRALYISAQTIPAEGGEIESLRQQLTESHNLFADAVQKLADASRKRKESQAREKVLRDTLEYIDEQLTNKFMWKGNTESNIGVTRCLAEIMPAVKEALSMPPDSAALDTAIRQAKQEALLEACEWFDGYDSRVHDNLRRMADNV